ncbi:MAG TPA: hypothetical protein PLN93_09475 [Vicinamibacterales bacterium]|nr:hypothetical protein [Vicinamibacterales bacterium]HPW20625.1 hypothetical protein [Vicinamibacterales bacterium]
MARLVKVVLTVAIVSIGVAALAAQEKVYPALRGDVEVGYLKPVTTVDYKAGMVKTVIKVKNLSTTGSIAGLKVEEYWFDKAGNPVTGSKDRLKKPLAPLETAELTLLTPRDTKMDRNSYTFSHANGKVKVKQMKEF